MYVSAQFMTSICLHCPIIVMTAVSFNCLKNVKTEASSVADYAVSFSDSILVVSKATIQLSSDSYVNNLMSCVKL